MILFPCQIIIYVQVQERAVQVKQVHVYLYVVGCKCIIVAPKEVHVMYIYICELVHASINSI